VSGGIPRLINLVCDRALLAGYAQGTRSISATMVEKSAAEVRGQAPTHGLRWRHGLIAAALTVALAVGAFALAPRLARAPAEVPQEAAAVPAAPERTDPAPPEPRRSERLDTLLRTTPREEAFRDALQAVAGRWSEPALARTTLRTHTDQLRRLDLPVLLEMFHPSRPDTSYLALLRLDGPVATVVVGGGEPMEVPLAQVEAFWNREAIFPWPETRMLSANPAAQGAWIRESLAGLGYTGDDTTDAVSRFQRDVGLVPDGVAGPRTRLVLFALSPGPRPRLSGGES
jgi:general secretion pathway protein A